MRFPPHFLDEIRSRLSVSQVVSRSVKLRRQGREFTGLSPFKQEKTPSFTVNDQKGFYHCFATGEHGDIFTFLIKTEGLSFPEAVEKLAGEAGVPMPVVSKEAEQKTEQNDRLREITEKSALFFEQSLLGPEGAQARNYLQQRGVSRDLAEKFRIGFAPNSRNALKQHLQQAGFGEKDIILSGMAIGGTDIPVPYDRFRGRIIFPITDLKNRVIAFGGRALDPDQKAKYLNSPETPLFHKGFQVYNGANARQAAYEQKTVIIAEGYMDVIALSSAGFQNAVAPLGTALTVEQLNLLWRMAEEPILCFDGDLAGKKAAFRAVETALPLLKPGFSLKFVFLPDGVDPDDYVRQHGREGMQLLLENSVPLSNVLWQKEYEAGDWNTPERRAALEQNLTNLVNSIENQTVRSHYFRDVKSKLWSAFQNRSTPNSKAGQSNAPQYRGSQSANSKYRGSNSYIAGKFANPVRQPASHSLLESPLTKGADRQNSAYEAAMLVILMNHPFLLESEDELVASLKFATPEAERLRDAILEAQFTEKSLDRAAIRSHLEKSNLYSLAAQMQSIVAQNGPKCAEPEADLKEVQEGWHELMVLHHKAEELKRELEAAERAFREEDNQQNFERLKSLREALNQSLNEVF